MENSMFPAMSPNPFGLQQRIPYRELTLTARVVVPQPK
jgi:hypothetical protein